VHSLGQKILAIGVTVLAGMLVGDADSSGHGKDTALSSIRKHDPFIELAGTSESIARANAVCLEFGTAGESRQVRKGDWKRWFPELRYSRGEEWLAIQEDSDGINVLRQHFVASRDGSPHVSMAADLAPRRTYRVSQLVKFESEFDWGGEHNQTGKIGFGIAGGAATSGGIIDPAGFSARWIWRGDGDGGAHLALYSYAADRSGQYGKDIKMPGGEINVGEWIGLVFEVRTNSSVSSKDGELRAWMNGEKLVMQTGIAWQTAGEEPKVDALTYASFYGGNDESWSPADDNFMMVADVCYFPTESL